MSNDAVLSAEPEPQGLNAFLQIFPSWDEALKEFLLQFDDPEEAMRAYVRQFETWDFPEGEWIGELVYALDFSMARYCYFIAKAPESYKGKRYRLIAPQRDQFRPSADSCNMAKYNDGLFRLHTQPVENGRDLWLQAQKVG